MIALYYTPLDSLGVTEALLKEALAYGGMDASRPQSPGLYPDYSRLCYVASSSIKVREAQKIFHACITGQNGQDMSRTSCYVPPEMMTLDQISKKAYALSGQKKVLHGTLLPIIVSLLSGKGVGFSALVADFMRDVRRTHPDKDGEGMKDMLMEIFSELNIPDSMTKLVLQCLDLYDRYTVFKGEHGLVDGEDVMHACQGRLSLLKHRVLVIDGFYDPDVIERDILRGLIHAAAFTLIAVPYDPQFRGLLEPFITFLKQEFPVEEKEISVRRDEEGSKPLHYCSYPDPEGEVEGIARNIKSRYLSGQFRKLEEIVVAFPSAEKYAPMVKRVFRRYGIPFDLVRKEPLGRRRAFLDLLCLLTAVAEDYPRLPFGQVLSSSYFRKMPASLRQWIPLLSLQSGIIAGKGPWFTLVTEGSETIDPRFLQDEGIRKDLAWVFKKLQPLEENRAGASLSVYADIIRRVTEDLGFLESWSQDLDPEGSDRVHDERKAFHDVLDHVSFLGSLHPVGIDLAQCIEMISHILNSTYLEEEGRGVRVMDFAEVMGGCPEYLFVGGLTDEEMPGRQELDYLLPDSVKKRLGFLSLDKYLDLQRFIFACVVYSSRHSHLSYPLADGDAVYLPSSFLYPGEEVREHIPGIFSREEFLVKKGGLPFSSHITEIRLGPSEHSFPSYMRVTDIDAYRFCPRKFFIEKMAGVSPLDIKEYEVEAMTLGNILHTFMERILSEPMGTLDDLMRKAAEIADQAMIEKKIPVYWKELIRDTFMEILPDIYEKEFEIRREGYIDSVLEKTVAGEPLKGIRLKGKIDRFDRIGGAIQIIDYKTGSPGFTCSQVVKGKENLQLFLYAAIMKSQGYAVDRVGIYSLRDIQVKWCPPRIRGKGKGKGKGKEEIDDYIVASLTFLEEAVKGMREGDFRAEPLHEYNCRNCHEYSWCPYIQQ
jgi:RecB family exonuclease